MKMRNATPKKKDRKIDCHGLSPTVCENKRKII
jgi:hypothetical protein